MLLSKGRASHVPLERFSPCRNSKNGIQIFVPDPGEGSQLWLCACRPSAGRLTVAGWRVDPITADFQVMVRWWLAPGAQVRSAAAAAAPTTAADSAACGWGRGTIDGSPDPLMRPATTQVARSGQGDRFGLALSP